MSTFSNKQDRAYARTAQDIERKYAFGKSFAETLGVANDTRDKVNAVESSLTGEVAELKSTLSRTAEQVNMQVERVDELSSKVDMKLDAEAVTIEVQKELEKGIDKVETKTGYKLDSDGLNITKSGTEMANLIDNTGMYVKKSGDNVLVANKDGVEATDLHAKTYLIIGAGDGRSRFEDYGVNRTGCFWVGG